MLSSADIAPVAGFNWSTAGFGSWAKGALVRHKDSVTNSAILIHVFTESSFSEQHAPVANAR
jgi:hypothetical protein